MPAFKRILNRSEEGAFEELQNLGADYGYAVYPKVRIADVLPIEGSGISDTLFSFALKAHYDFVACDTDNYPTFAVEFDGPPHQTDEQRARDEQKNELCKRFELPILRINSNHLVQKYHKASLLRWIVSAWELKKSFDEAQARGDIPYEEDFDPIFLWHPGKTREEVHPHWIALRHQIEIERLRKSGRITGFPCGFVFKDENDNYRGIEWIDIAENEVVVVESAMRSQLFPLRLGELFDELMTILLHEKVMDCLDGRPETATPEQVASRVLELKQKYRSTSFHGGPTQVSFSMSLSSGKWV